LNRFRQKPENDVQVPAVWDGCASSRVSLERAWFIMIGNFT